MSVHYKFKAALDYSTVTFDGIHISVGDLKKEIVEQKRLGKNADFDLQIQNAQTKEVYQDEITLIPKNTSVIVARVPTADKKKSQGPGGGGGGGGGGGPGGGRDGGRFAAMQRNHLASLPPAALAKGVDLATMDNMSEDEKIKAMMNQSTADYDVSRYMKIRGSNQHGRVPDNYRCYKCNNAGHWIKNCPMVSHDNSDVKKSTGIPRSFMVMVEGPEVPGALITPEGQYAVPAIDREAYTSKNKPPAEPVQKPKIPEELICPICQDLLTDALLVPCCANSYCDECIRNTLLESDDLECPGCHEKDTSPNELIPNRFLRTAVTAFKNETGYSKPTKLPEKKDKDSHKEEQAAAAESRKISLEEELPDDLFPHSPRKIDLEDHADSSKADDGDLYDFNDGSIPSPFAVQDNTNSKSTPGKESSARESDSRPQPGGPPHYQGPPHMHSQPRGDYNDFRGPPPQYNRGPHPSHHPYGGPPPQHHQGEREPPPPGFGDVLPPGEERMQLPPPMRHPNSGPPHHMMGPRDDRQGPPGPGGPPPLMQGPPPPGAFMQPPPGYGPPGSMHRPPPMGGPPPSGQFPPNQYPPNFSRMPPPPGGDPMYPPGPYPLMDSRHRDRDRERDRERDRDRERERDRDRGRDRERERDDYDRGRGPPRRSFHRDGSGPARIGGRLPGDENRPGPIEDPLKEFERLMREKDRRKQQMSGALKKRSKSRSITPPPRRSPSPHLRKRTRSPSFPRSPSPKRKRILPILKRRNSYSRSRSRTPPQPVRRAPRSRSRSRDRDRNRSGSPHFPKRVERVERERDRRSPRRAPPFSPSPPPPSRYPKKEKDEYFRDEHQSRYDDRHSRYSSSSKRHSSRDYEGNSKYEGTSKYDGASVTADRKYDSSGKYDDRYDEKYPQEKYDSGVSRHDPHHSSSSNSNRYEYPNKSSSSRSYHSTSHRSAQPSSTGPSTASPGGQRDRDKAYFDSNQNSNSRRPYEYDPSLVPPGTDAASVPSLLDINVDIPPGLRNMDYHNDSRGPVPDLVEKSENKFPVDIKVKKEDEKVVQEKQVSEKDTNSAESKKDSKEHRRRKSSEDKKLKKKKHKKEKKKDKEEKKDKKRKKSKDGEGPGETLAGLLIDPTTLEIESKGDTSGSVIGMDSKIVDNELRLTAPCDSTVKSPDRPGLHKDAVDVPKIGNRSIETRLSQDDTFPPGVDEPIDNAFISNRGVEMSDLAKQTSAITDNEKTSQDANGGQGFVVPMPASKWDKFDESDDPNGTFSSKNDAFQGELSEKSSKDHQTGRVPADVIRRAENVIFEKPITVQTISVMVTTAEDPKALNQVKKITLSNIGTLPPEDLKDTGKESDGEGKQGKSLVASAVFRRPLKDRLGSKVPEDEAVRTPKEEDPRGVSSNTRPRRTPPRESRDRRRSRSKSPARADKDKPRRERSRSTRRDKSRSPAKRGRSRTPPRRERDERRGRSKSPQRRERTRSPRPVADRPPHRRDRSRSPIIQRRDRSRSPIAQRRDRSRSPVPQRRDRSRSPVAQRRDRSREKRERDRLVEPRVPDRSERRRSRSRSKDRRHNPRSPIQLPSRVGLKARTPELPRRNYDRNTDSRHEQSESSRRRRSPNKDNSPPGQSGRSPKRDRPSSGELKSRSSDKARDGASGVAAAFTNDYADLKKTKQRINIKLSSTAKLERDSNSSSSDEQEGPEESVSESVLVPASLENPATDPVTGLVLDPANAAKKKKKAKKHRSSSSSSSSSSSDGKHKKKSKKSKKKKKKKKKSK